MFYLGKAPPLRTGAGKGGSGRGEKDGRGGREGVGPRRPGSVAAFAQRELTKSRKQAMPLFHTAVESLGPM